MIEDKNEIRSNTKTTELRESGDNVYERNFLRHELETMGIDITYSE